MKQKWVLIVAILVGIAAFWLTGYYLKLEKAKILGEARQIGVVVAASDLPMGSVLKKNDLAEGYVFRKDVSDRVILSESFREIIGKKLSFNISRGTPLQWTDIDVPFRGEVGLAETINSGSVISCSS